MFTVKQELGCRHCIWPDINCVTTDALNASGRIDSVTGVFKDGGTIEFHAGPAPQTIYVMNERGATVARYELSGGGLTCANPDTSGFGQSIPLAA